MKTVKINLYSFGELSPASQRKAIENLSDINVHDEWWNFIYEDAERIGLKIGSFDIEYRGYIHGALTQDAETVAAAIVAEYGGPIHALAANYLATLEHLRVNISEDSIEEETETLSEKFEKDLLQIYLTDLREHYEHLISDDAIKDTIEANDYLFFENGKLIPVSMYPAKRRTIGEKIRAIIARMRARFAPVDLVLFAPATAAIIYAFLNQ